MLDFLREPISALLRNRGLVRELSRRELSQRFVGSMLGPSWILIQPVALLLVYILVFGSFRAGVAGSEEPLQFVARLFVGILVFGLFSETISTSPKLVVSRPNFVKKVRFPLEILPFPGLSVTLINFLIGLGVLLTFRGVFAGGFGAAALASPLLVLPLILLSLALSWTLSAVGVFVRDLQEIVRVVVQLLFFLSPVVWTVDFLPEESRSWVLLNPIALTIEWVRAAIARGELPDPAMFVVITALAFLAACLGLSFFRKAREGFADVL